LGPIIGGAYFYSEGGVEVAHGQLYIPYMGVGIIVLVLAALFFFAYVPDIKSEDIYRTDEGQVADESAGHAGKQYNRVAIFILMVLNVAVLGFAIYMILNLILPACGVGPDLAKRIAPTAAILPVVASALLLIPVSRNITHNNIWAHPHFSSATLTQFLYVAAQAGIFSFFINYIISEMPSIAKNDRGWLVDSWQCCPARRRLLRERERRDAPVRLWRLCTVLSRPLCWFSAYQ
jgi:FHS family L-fucose permease-like MFS transporter